MQITEDNHLKVYSTGGFTIKVKSIDPNLTSSTNTGTTIAASDITVTATKGSVDGVESFSATPVTLSTSDSPLIFSNTGANNKTFNPNSAIEKKEYFSILISNCVAVEKNKR